MIARRIEDGQVFIAFGLDRLDKDLIEIISSNGIAKSVSKETYTLYFDESEVQQRIEAAVAEHLATTQETDDLNEILRNKVKKLEATDHELRACIEKLQLKCDRLEEEKEDLNECIAELEAERQPVEVSAELAEALNFLELNFPTSWEGRIFEFLYKDLDIYKEQADIIKSASYSLLTKIFKRGYTVKPDPLRERISAILGKDHEQLDAVVAAAREGEAE